MLLNSFSLFIFLLGRYLDLKVIFEFQVNLANKEHDNQLASARMNIFYLLLTDAKEMSFF